MRHHCFEAGEASKTPANSRIVTRQVYGKQYRPHSLESLNKTEFVVAFFSTDSHWHRQITKVMLRVIGGGKVSLWKFLLA